MYGIFTYIYLKFKPNVDKYSLHGASGISIITLQSGLSGMSSSQSGLDRKKLKSTWHSTCVLMCTLPKTNTAPENRGSSLFATIFQGRALSFAECNSLSKKQTERTMATESIFLWHEWHKILLPGLYILLAAFQAFKMLIVVRFHWKKKKTNIQELP